MTTEEDPAAGEDLAPRRCPGERGDRGDLLLPEVIRHRRHRRKADARGTQVQRRKFRLPGAEWPEQSVFGQGQDALQPQRLMQA